MFKNFGKRDGFKSNAVNTCFFPQNSYFGKTNNIHKTRHENLKLVKQILEKHNIRYCLLFGTLLGSYRESNFIEGDGDDDLYIDPIHISDFNDTMLKEFENCGFYWLRSWKNRLVSIGRNGRYIDFCFLGEHSNKKYKDYYDYDGYCFYHKKYFQEKFKLGLLNGESYPVISNSKGFLQACYGKNFMVPNNNGYFNYIVNYLQ